jgi:uncharacterized protein DUF1566
MSLTDLRDRLVLNIPSALGASCTFALSIGLIVAPLVAQEKSAPVNQNSEDHGWTDSRTGLTWTPWDNAYNVTWAEAISYCRDLKFDGNQDWRLPDIAELEAVYDPNAPGLIPGPVQRSSEWVWSATQTNMHGGNWGTSAWLFSFVSGRRIEHGVLTFRAFRALCVRGPQKAAQNDSTFYGGWRALFDAA